MYVFCHNSSRNFELTFLAVPMDLQVGNETIEINDHRMVLQLADEINAYNGGNDTELAVHFIPWYNTHPK